MKIEKITKLKSGKYKLKLDNDEVLTTYDDVILNNNLLFHKEIDDEIYLKLKSDSEYYDLLNSVIKYISKRLRSEKEIRIYLEKKTLDNDLIDNIISNLKDKNYINDKRFARAYINDRLNLSNIGILKIKHELSNLGISDEIIEDEVSNIDIKLDNDKLEKLIIKKIKSNHKYSNNILKQKIINDMINLGYEKEDIVNIYDKNVVDDNDIYEKEYDKLYNKLKYKYEGKELEYHIKQKLYSKGFISEK